MIFYEGASNYFSAPGVGEGYWTDAFHLDDIGIDLSDGHWHRIALLEDISATRMTPPGPLHVTLWVDGQEILDRDVPVDADYVSQNGPVAFRLIYFLENFCGTTNDGPVTYGIDDIELWDGQPDQ